MAETQNIAIFADFENIALGVKEANYEAFDIQLIIERLLDQGRVLVKRAYADWQRYKYYRKDMHQAGFELLEVPHASYSGKNSADIHMVCDALDLCYTRDHIDTFVILSGDSDFSPLVRRLRENNKLVIGVGVKMSTSNLLVESCDEFIYYDDIVRRKKANSGRRSKGESRRGGNGSKSNKPKESKVVPASVPASAAAAPTKGAPTQQDKSKPSAPASKGREEQLGTQQDGLDLVLDVVESLFEQRESNIWASMAKQVLKRRKPNFDESYYGYRSFSQLISDANEKGLLEVQKDEKSGGQIIVGFGPNA